MDRPLVGRDLPEVTPALRREGVDLDTLYAMVTVPIDWVRRERLEHALSTALAQTFAAYAVQPPEDAVSRAMAAHVQDGRVDFGRLDEAMQRDVIRRVLVSSEARGAVAPAGPDTRLPSSDTLARNRSAVTSRFGLAGYGSRLVAIYESLLAGSTHGGVDTLPAEALVSRFLAPERMNLLRT